MDAASSRLGVGIHEARHRHRLLYGGLVCLTLACIYIFAFSFEYSQMDFSRRSPAEIGHAAAYEAFRYLLHHAPIRDHLSEDHDRRREVLIALAIAEGTTLSSVRKYL
jgi:hypothetical protein